MFKVVSPNTVGATQMFKEMYNRLVADRTTMHNQQYVNLVATITMYKVVYNKVEQLPHHHHHHQHTLLHTYNPDLRTELPHISTIRKVIFLGKICNSNREKINLIPILSILYLHIIFFFFENFQ